MLKAHFQHLQAECRRLHFVRTSGLLPFVGACKWLQNFVRAPGLGPSRPVQVSAHQVSLIEKGLFPLVPVEKDLQQ